MSAGRIRVAAALAAALLILVLGPGSRIAGAGTEAGFPLPAGTEFVRGLPPYHAPPGDRAAIEAWCEEAERAARSLPDRPEALDLLYSAAWTRARELRQPREAADVFEEVAADAPRGSVVAPVARLEAAALRLGRGDTSGARRDLDGALALTVGPYEPTASADPVRDEALWSRLERLRGPLEVRVLVAEGRFREAAERLEGSPAEAGGHTAAWGWAEAARLRHRAGDAEGAGRDIEQAIATADDEDDLVAWVFWRLHLRHGLLDENGEITLSGDPPKAGYLEDAYAALRGLAGNPYVGPHLLGLASQALLAGELPVALELYDMALGDRALQERARKDDSVARGLLAAFPVALQLERYEEAGAILDALGTMTRLPAAELDGWRDVLARAQAEAAKRRALDEEPPRPSKGAPATHRAEPPTSRGRLCPAPPESRTPAASGPAARPGQGASAPPTPEASKAPLLVGILALALAGLLLVRYVARRVARRRG